MNVPTQSEVYSQLIEHLVKAQESAAMMGHLLNMQDNDSDHLLATGWIGISELMKRMQHQVVKLATKGLMQ